MIPTKDESDNRIDLESGKGGNDDTRRTQDGQRIAERRGNVELASHAFLEAWSGAAVTAADRIFVCSTWMVSGMPTSCRQPARNADDRTFDKVAKVERKGALLRDLSGFRRVSGRNSLVGHRSLEILAD
jgi:hypothetical protein